MGKNNTYSVEIMKNSINATNGYKDITIKNTDLVNSRFVDEILDVFFRIEGDALVDEDVEIIKKGLETVNSRFKDLFETTPSSKEDHFKKWYCCEPPNFEHGYSTATPRSPFIDEKKLKAFEKELSEENLKKDTTAFNVSLGDLVDKMSKAQKWGENKERNENIKKAIERGVESFDKLSLEDSKKAWEEMSNILFKKRGF